MKLTFKHILIGLIGLILLAALLHQQIIGGMVFFMAKQNATQNSSVYVAPAEKTLAYHATATTSEYAFDSFHTLHFPILFPEHGVRYRSDDALAITSSSSNARIVIQRDANYVAAFMGDAKHSEEEVNITCATLTASNQTNICSSNYEFLSAFLTTTPKTAHFFSSREKKIATAALLLIKATVLSDTVHSITPITGDAGLRGYLLHAAQSDIVYLFDAEDHFYTLLLYHFSDDDIEALLSNTMTIPTTETP